MKQSELQKCAFCGHGMAHANDLTFMRLKVDYMMIKPDAVRRQAGLEMVTGNPMIAAVMGPDEDMAAQVSTRTVLVCLQCAMKPQPLLMLLEEEDEQT